MPPPPIEPDGPIEPGPGTIPLSSLSNVVGPVGLGRILAGAGPVIPLTPAEITLNLVLLANAQIQRDGLLPWGVRAAHPRPRVALLPDANATIEPVADQIGIYVLLGPLTANRVLTITDNASMNTLVFQVAALDMSAFTYTIQRSTGPLTLYTKAASPTNPLVFQFYKTGGLWTQNTQWWGIP